MPTTTVVRYVALLLALLGIVMLIWRTASSGSGPGYDTVRLIHILVALGFIGPPDTPRNLLNSLSFPAKLAAGT